MKKILVPTDFSDNAYKAAEYAIKIADYLNGTVTLYHAFQIQSTTGSFASTKHFIEADASDRMNEFAQKLAPIANANANANGVELETKVVQGDTIACITDRANKMGYDLVVMGTKGATGLKEVFIGSVTSTILKKVDIPVLAVPDKFDFDIVKKIVFAVDSKGIDKVESVKPLIDLTKLLDATVIIYHLSEGDEQGDLDIAPAVDLLLKDIKHSFFTEEKVSSVNESINEFVAKEKADIICMLRRKKTLWDRIFFESSTKREVFDSPVPLLILQDN